nr:hypothetical protein [Tanacetum cinerariifolium]
MEMAIEQNCAAKTEFQSKLETVLNENDRILKHALGVDIVNIVVNNCMKVNCVTVDACEQCVTTESELKSDFIKKENYEMLLKQYNTLEKHCISLELDNQLNTEIFQRDNVSSSEKKIKSLRADEKESKVEDIETQNIELDHRVDVVPQVPKLRKNRTAHIDYLKHTLDEAATLRELVESERLLSPLNTPLAYACKYTRRIQELLMILQQTYPRITELGTKPVAITPKNQNQQ